MNRRLGVGEPRQNGKGSANGGGKGEITTQSCPTRGCPIEGLIAYGYAVPYGGYPGGATGWDQGGWGSSYYDTGSGPGYDPGNPDPVAPKDPCNTGDTMLDDAVVNEGFKDMWEASNAGAASFGDRVEQYGWLVRTAVGYRVHPIGSGNVCGATFETSQAPPEGYDAVVGFIHTHPYTVGETIASCGADGKINGFGPYPGTPSDIDREASIQLGTFLGRGEPLAGLILDANGIRTFKGTEAAMDGTVERCGY